MGILENWLSDLPQQFQNKKNIEILIRAFSRQLEEVKKVFDDLDNKTDLENAEGKQLDHVGGIVHLSRKDAGLLTGLGIDEPVIEDERYRKLLTYKVLSNTSDCTYNDLMESLEILWKTEGIKYFEDPNRPATIFLILPKSDISDNFILPFERKLVVKASGVSVLYKLIYTTEMNVINEEKFTITSIKNRMKFPFFKNFNTLNGSFLLDGTEYLSAMYPDYKIYNTIKFSSSTIEKFETLRNSIKMKLNLNERIEMLDRYRSVVDTSEQVKMVETRSRLNTENNEQFEGAVTIKKNLWYLDGSFSLDGEKTLNASITKEDL